jgi:hypothetical protein
MITPEMIGMSSRRLSKDAGPGRDAVRAASPSVNQMYFTGYICLIDVLTPGDTGGMAAVTREESRSGR